jgi:hypothetical protein
VTDYLIPKPFRRTLRKKPLVMRLAITECIKRLAENPRHPGLHTHRVQGTDGVFEAYVDDGNRLTFHYEGSTIVLRNHCNHDMLKRNP